MDPLIKLDFVGPITDTRRKQTKFRVLGFGALRS